MPLSNNGKMHARILLFDKHNSLPARLSEDAYFKLDFVSCPVNAECGLAAEGVRAVLRHRLKLFVLRFGDAGVQKYGNDEASVCVCDVQDEKEGANCDVRLGALSLETACLCLLLGVPCFDMCHSGKKDWVKRQETVKQAKLAEISEKRGRFSQEFKTAFQKPVFNSASVRIPDRNCKNKGGAAWKRFSDELSAFEKQVAKMVRNKRSK
jgi:hypothetical protein